MAIKFKSAPFVLKPLRNYFPDTYPKRQIYLHHTSGANASGSLSWAYEQGNGVAAQIYIEHNGDVYCAFPINCWAYHLGLKPKHLTAPNALTHNELSQQSIAIELCSWGGLTETPTGKIKTWNDKPFMGEVIKYDAPYRGYTLFEEYSHAQIDSLYELLTFLGNIFHIPTKTPNVKRLFEVCPEAIQGRPGIYTHASVRPDKSDCHPDTKLISMLKSL